MKKLFAILPLAIPSLPCRRISRSWPGRSSTSRANSAKTEREIENEVDRYIMQPGSVPCYKIGELKIRELRRYAEKELGPKFDIRAFHDQILGGGQLPLDLLEKKVKGWVASQR